MVRRNCTLNVAAPPPRRPAAGGGKLGKLGMSFGGKGRKEDPGIAKPAKEEKEEVELD